jgi:hypothetical protein
MHTANGGQIRSLTERNRAQTTILMLALFVALFACRLFAGPAESVAGPDMPKEVRSFLDSITWIEIPLDGFTNSVGRVQFARSLENYFASLDKFLPNLHPRESDWVDREWNRVMGILVQPARSREIAALTSSREWLIWNAREELKRLRETAKGIAEKSYLKKEHISGKFLSRSTIQDNEDAEMSAWVGFVNVLLLSQMGDSMKLLEQKHGLSLPKKTQLMVGLHTSPSGVRTIENLICGGINQGIFEAYFYPRRIIKFERPIPITPSAN